MKKIFITGIIIGSWIVIGFLGKHRPRSSSIVMSQSLPVRKASPIVTSSSPIGSSLVVPASADLQSKLGEVEVEYLSDGRIASIHGKVGGKVGESSNVSRPFHPEDASQAIARALEILEWTHDSLGIRKSLPLGKPRYRGNEVSAQITFRETAEGQPIYPFGGVSIDLGRDGELLGLYSDYVSSLKVSNASDPALPVDQAKQQIASALGLSPVQGGVPIVWSSPTDSSGEARRAYQFYARGWEIVTDATTGAILSRRDRRNF
jgi:hypothetical protein